MSQVSHSAEPKEPFFAKCKIFPRRWAGNASLGGDEPPSSKNYSQKTTIVLVDFAHAIAKPVQRSFHLGQSLRDYESRANDHLTHLACEDRIANCFPIAKRDLPKESLCVNIREPIPDILGNRKSPLAS